VSEPSVLTHRVDGDGEPLVLLNGGMMTIASWDAVVAALGPGYRVVRCDLRGQLLSSGPPHRDLADNARDVVALLDALGIGAARVIATSFGAEVALVLAARFPERVSALVAATVADVTPALSAQLLTLCRAITENLTNGDRGQLFDLIMPVVYSPGYLATHAAEFASRRTQFMGLPDDWFAGVQGLFEALVDFDLWPYLGAVRCPTLMIAAEDDVLMLPARVREVAAAIGGARLETVAGSGHVLVNEKPQEFVALCLRFLAEVKDLGGPS
jgi:pimeloyl-ACP methyl ester carboxylesterase